MKMLKNPNEVVRDAYSQDQQYGKLKEVDGKNEK